MQTPTATALRLLDLITAPHIGPHTCTDGLWYNPRAASGSDCETNTDLLELRAAVLTLDTAVLTAADDPAAVDVVVEALLSGPLEELGEEEQEGWRYMAREGMEALHRWLRPQGTDSVACPSCGAPPDAPCSHPSAVTP